LLRGDATTCAAWQRAVERGYRPAVHTLDLAVQASLPGTLSKPHEALAGHGLATAWVCRGTTCLPPIHSLAALKAAIDGAD
jgi:uncharacterized protein YyaL (SSP411 family)